MIMEKKVAAVDLGASKTRTALIDQKGRILDKKETATPKSSARAITGNIISQVKKLKGFSAIGISATGPIDFKKGALKNPSNIDSKEVPLKRPLEKEFNLPVFLYNDAASAVWGEKHFGLKKNYRNIVFVTISSGIGAGAIVDNHLLIGKDGNAAEVGHFIVDSEYNLPCSCKRGKGHWEGYSSGRNLPRFFKHWLSFHNLKKKYKIEKPEDIFKLSKDKTVAEFLKEVNRINARGISNIITAYSPEIVVLGGSVFLKNEKLLLSGIEKNAEKFLPLPEIKATALKEDVSLLGAAAVVFWPPNEK